MRYAAIFLGDMHFSGSTLLLTLSSANLSSAIFFGTLIQLTVILRSVFFFVCYATLNNTNLTLCNIEQHFLGTLDYTAQGIAVQFQVKFPKNRAEKDAC